MDKEELHSKFDGETPDWLKSMRKEHGFSVPEGFMDNFQVQLNSNLAEEIIKTEGLEAAKPLLVPDAEFKVPDGYFDHFAQQMQFKIRSEEKGSQGAGWKIFLLNLFTPKFAMPVMFGVLIMALGLYNNKPGGDLMYTPVFAHVSKEEARSEVEKYLDTEVLDEDLLIQEVDDAHLADPATDGSSEDYLIENADEVQLLEEI